MAWFHWTENGDTLAVNLARVRRIRFMQRAGEAPAEVGFQYTDGEHFRAVMTPQRAEELKRLVGAGEPVAPPW